MKEKVLITESRLAKLFQFSERKVRTYFKEARVKPATYDFIRTVEIYVENNSGKDEANELKRVEREHKEYKLGILKKEYHSAEEVTRIVSDMNYRFKSKLLSFPQKISFLLLNKSKQLEIEKILKKEVNNALEELTEYKYQEIERFEDEE